MAAVRILVVTDWYPTGPGDPAGSFVRGQALAVSERHEVAVLHLADPEPSGSRFRLSAEQDGPLLTLRLRRRPGPPITAGNLAALATALRRLRRRGFVPELLHAHEVGAGFASAVVGGALRRPLVFSVHQATYALGELDAVTERLSRATFARAAVVCPPSVSQRARLEADGWPGRFQVVPNVVDVERFAPRGAPPDGPPRIVVVASLDPVKGVRELVEAAGILVRRGVPFRVDLVGDGTLREELTRRVRELGIGAQVVLHGTLPAEQVAALMREGSFAVVPSLWETFSVVLAEAMACGLPVVATAVGALPERVNAGNGMLVPARDPEALADGMTAMIERHREYDRAAIARETRARFSPAAVGLRWDEVYRGAVEHGVARRRVPAAD